MKVTTRPVVGVIVPPSDDQEEDLTIVESLTVAVITGDVPEAMGGATLKVKPVMKILFPPLPPHPDRGSKASNTTKRGYTFRRNSKSSSYLTAEFAAKMGIKIDRTTNPTNPPT